VFHNHTFQKEVKNNNKSVNEDYTCQTIN